VPARRVRAIIVREQYRVIRKPSPRPRRGGGWLVAGGLLGGLAVIGKLAGGDASPNPAAERQVVIEADAWNQCYLDVFANGEKFRMLADSGAAGVFFSMKDARRLGYDPRRLAFDHSYQGWGWRVNGATVTLRTLEVAGVTLRDVEAGIDQLGSVTDQGPLLGSTVLNAFKFQVRNGSCALTVPVR